MFCRKLLSIYVTNKNNNIYEYIVDYGINLEEITEFIKKEYGNNFKEVKLGCTVSYLYKSEDKK